MKNNQKGAIGIILVIIAALVIGGSLYFATQKENVNAVNEKLNITENSNQNVNTGVNIETNLDISKPIPQVLTDAEIMGATYPLSANFEGVRTSQINVIFPSYTGDANRMSGIVYINKNGSIITNATPGVEGFWISYYKYTDSTRTEAMVIITGNYGASGYDDRAFIVSKIDGKVITKETTCNKSSNGSCLVER